MRRGVRLRVMRSVVAQRDIGFKPAAETFHKYVWAGFPNRRRIGRVHQSAREVFAELAFRSAADDAKVVRAARQSSPTMGELAGGFWPSE